MSSREQSQLARSLERSRQQCRDLQAENDELWEANRAICVERDATDALLGEALDVINERIRKLGG
jgi:hypothetical protein